jgi:patatin-related protein
MTKTGGEELRIALGMRGGVSLAVWIGGACREIDALRRAPEEGDGFWSRVRAIAGYEAVAVDVMAGASAGGLNGAIYAASQVYGFSLESLRTIWLDVGDLGAMVRAPAGNGDGVGAAPCPYPSVLLGDDYLFKKTFETLASLMPEGKAPDPPPRVDLTLTATLVEPIGGPSREGMSDAVDDRFTSTFRFRNRGPGWLTDFSPAGTPEGRRTAARLALAARATSSFPVAHEAAAIRASRPSSFAGAKSAAGDGLAVDMAGVFGEATAGDRPFLVVDGGVLDNIPLGRAISAVADAPAAGPTRRVLVYVRPGAPSAEPPSRQGPPDRSSANVVRSAIRARVRPETIAGDLAALDEQNLRVDGARRLRALTFADIEDRGALCGQGRAIDATYVLHRADADAQEIRRLLDDPIEVLGHDPFPGDRGVGDAAWRKPLGPWSERERLHLDGSLTDELSDRIGKGALTVGVGPVGRLAALLLEWARFVERHATEARRSAGGAKDRLYRALTVQRELMERPRRLAWVVMAATRRPREDSWAAHGLSTVERLLAVSAKEERAVREYFDTGDERSLTAVHREMLRRLDLLLSRRGDGGRLPGGEKNLRDLVVDCLVGVADELASADVAPFLLRQDHELPDAAAWLHRALSSGGTGGTRLERGDLEALEKVAFQESVVAAPGRRGIEMVELSSASRTPISAAFPQLLGYEAAGSEAWGTITERLSEAPKLIATDKKLAGNELSNFAAFLRPIWRANDWMWGRLDAIPPIVDVLVTAEQLVIAAERTLDGEGPAGRERAVRELREELRRAVAEPGPAAGLSWSRFLEETAWAPREADITRLVRSAVDQAVARSEAGTAEPRPAQMDKRLLQVLRDALISARQWLVVAEELAKQDAAAPEAPVFGPRETVEAADRYAVGAETLTNPAVADDSKLVRKLLVAARGAARCNVSDRVPRIVLGTVESLGALLSWAWLGRRIAFKITAVGLSVVALLALLVLPPWGSSAQGWSRLWAITAVPGALAVVAGAGAALLGRRKAALASVLAGAPLVVVAGTVGGNWLGSSAILTAVGLLAAGALWVVAWLRLRLGRRRAAASPEPVM